MILVIALAAGEWKSGRWPSIMLSGFSDAVEKATQIYELQIELVGMTGLEPATSTSRKFPVTQMQEVGFSISLRISAGN
jgi:hypothetical protein